MTRRRDVGVCLAFLRHGGSIAFRREDYPTLLSEWMRGAAFFEGAGVQGEVSHVKLGEVCGIVHWTAEQLAADRAEDRENAAEDKTDSMLSGDG